MERIAVFGLGAIGFGLASNLLRASYPVRVVAHRSRHSINQLVDEGAIECDSRIEAVALSDVVILCLPGSDDVSSVIEEVLPALESRHLVVDMGTSSVSRSRANALHLGSHGVAFAEAPVAGGKLQSLSAELGAFVGADAEVFVRLKPILEKTCASIEHFGEVGQGGIAKLISNYLVLSMVRSIVETFHAAEVAHIDWGQFYRTVTRGSGNSVSLRRMVGTLLENEHYQGYVFSVRNARKDLEYAAELGELTGLDSTLSDAALRLFAEADALGHGDRMVSELLRKDIRDMLGELQGVSSTSAPGGDETIS